MLSKLALSTSLIFLGQFSFAEEEGPVQPVHAVIDCEHVMSNESSTAFMFFTKTNSSSTHLSTDFVLDSQGTQSAIFSPFFTRDTSSFVLALTRQGSVSRGAGAATEFIGTSYVLSVTRAANPRDRIGYERKPHPVATGRVQGQTSLWLNITSNADGTVEIDGIDAQGTKGNAYKATDGKIDVVLKYGVVPDGRSNLLSAVGRRFGFKRSAQQGFELRLKIEVSRDGGVKVEGQKLLTSETRAETAALDGKTYCRKLSAEGFPSQNPNPEHCISFASGVATDYAGANFGNAPESHEYKITDGHVTFGDFKYAISADQKSLTTVKGSATEGTILTLKEPRSEPQAL